MPKQPAAAFDNVFAFAPNRETLGATAYLIVEKDGNILIDCPAWDEGTQQFLQEKGGVRWLVITHRGSIGSARKLQADCNCAIAMQEQEAYLLPGLDITKFQHELTLQPNLQLIWTPGHSPGSTCVYYAEHGGILFTGRHLLPDQHGNPVPLRTAKTFHWPRQLRSVEKLFDSFSTETLQFICPGANTGLLRGKRSIDRAYARLQQINLEAQRTVSVY